MTTYEYKVVSMEPAFDHRLEGELNSKSGQGWEVIFIEYSKTRVKIIFRRPLASNH